jgi:hypothetical protein
MKQAVGITVCALGALLVVGIFSTCERQSPLAPPGPMETVDRTAKVPGLQLEVTKTADSFWERRTEYDWTIEKAADPISLDICSGASGMITYTLTATRTLASESEVFGVQGEICISNTGTASTEEMSVVDEIWSKTGEDPWELYLSVDIDVSANPVLDPGESHCYPYEIAFTPIPGARYKNIVYVYDIDFRASSNVIHFELPAMPISTEYDAEADVTDVQYCPDGFSCTPSDPGPWHLYDSEIISFTKDVYNESTMCDTYYYLDNDATLEEMDSGETHTASARVTIYTCPCDTGCSLTIGYWKTHAGFHGNNADRVSEHLPIWLGNAGGAASVQVTTAAQAVEVLSMNLGHPSNGITRVYAQLLGVKLNIARGADDSAIAGTIADADEFLSMHDYNDWRGLTRPVKQMVRDWATTFDDYNNGRIGPGHCDD